MEVTIMIHLEHHLRIALIFFKFTGLQCKSICYKENCGQGLFLVKKIVPPSLKTLKYFVNDTFIGQSCNSFSFLVLKIEGQLKNTCSSTFSIHYSFRKSGYAGHRLANSQRLPVEVCASGIWIFINFFSPLSLRIQYF